MTASRRSLPLLALALALAAGPALPAAAAPPQREVSQLEGVRFARRLRAGDTELHLHRLALLRTRDGLARNLDAAALSALRERVERLEALYASVQPGDRYALTYVPGRGTELALNGVSRGRIEGADFAAALFSIWLGEAPLDASLKAELLGRS